MCSLSSRRRRAPRRPPCSALPRPSDPSPALPLPPPRAHPCSCTKRGRRTRCGRRPGQGRAVSQAASALISAQLALEASSPSGPLLITTERMADLSATSLRAAIDTVFSYPGVVPATLSTLLSAEPAGAGSIAQPDEDAATSLNALLAGEARITQFSSIIDDPSLLTAPRTLRAPPAHRGRLARRARRMAGRSRRTCRGDDDDTEFRRDTRAEHRATGQPGGRAALLHSQ